MAEGAAVVTVLTAAMAWAVLLAVSVRPEVTLAMIVGVGESVSVIISAAVKGVVVINKFGADDGTVPALVLIGLLVGAAMVS